MNSRHSLKVQSKEKKQKNPLAHHVTEAIRLLDKLEVEIVGDAPALTHLDKVRRTRARKGSDRVVTTVAQLVEQFGLTSEALQPTAMLERLAQAQTVAPLQKRLEQLLKRVGDVVFLADSDAWEQASVGYASLRHLAKKRGDVAASLTPVEAFFAARHPSVIAERAEKRAKAAADKAAKQAAKAAAKAAAKGAKSEASGNDAPQAPSANGVAKSGSLVNGAALNGAAHA